MKIMLCRQHYHNEQHKSEYNETKISKTTLFLQSVGANLDAVTHIISFRDTVDLHVLYG